MGKFVDITGNRYGKLVVIKRAESRKIGSRMRTFWECRCDCGNTVEVCGEHLKAGHTKSCGCLASEFSGEDLSESRFGRLTVVGFAEVRKRGNGR